MAPFCIWDNVHASVLAPATGAGVVSTCKVSNYHHKHIRQSIVLLKEAVEGWEYQEGEGTTHPWCKVTHHLPPAAKNPQQNQTWANSAAGSSEELQTKEMADGGWSSAVTP